MPEAPRIRELEAGQTGLAFEAMAELRTAFAADRDRFMVQIDEQQRPQGYRLFAAFEPEAADDADAVAAAGFRRVVSLAWGDVLYLDDLSTATRARRRGYGTALLAAVEAEAVRLGCEAVHLDSGHHRYHAHRLYLTAGYQIRSHHLLRTLP